MKLITRKCHDAISCEIDDIKKNQQPAIAQELDEARSHGDLRENAQYASAREKQRMIEARLNELEEVLLTHTIFDLTDKTFDTISFGATVELQFLDDNTTKKFQILSDYDADINKGIISINAPIAKAILGMQEGDESAVILAGKTREVLIKKVV
jgi:transcription elongation factor GreA